MTRNELKDVNERGLEFRPSASQLSKLSVIGVLLAMKTAP